MMVISKRRAASTFLIMMFALFSLGLPAVSVAGSLGYRNRNSIFCTPAQLATCNLQLAFGNLGQRAVAMFTRLRQISL